jgi:hypothetical protein
MKGWYDSHPQLFHKHPLIVRDATPNVKESEHVFEVAD